MTTFAPELYERAGAEGTRRRQVVSVMQAALAAVDPYAAVRGQLRLQNDRLQVGDRIYDLAQYDRVLVVGAGKAGAPMARAVEDVLGRRIARGHVNVKYGHALPTRIVRIHEAGHPIPDQAGLDGAREIATLLQHAGPRDLVLCLISGGGSALMSLPVPGVSLADIKALTNALLRVGATINEINTIRKHLEQLKGGKLARLAHPAQVVTLALSDVVGNPPDVIASGPTVPDSSTFGDACELVQRYGLDDELPAMVMSHLRAGAEGEIPDTPKAGDPVFVGSQNIIVASNDIAGQAAEAKARELGFSTLFLSSFVEGEAREVAKVLVAIAREIRASGRPLRAPACLIAGGETTVTLRGNGQGGRNQEMALAGALGLDGMDNVILACLATDGTDGPTDASGALADGQTLTRARARGLDARAHLENNDAYPFFATLGDLLMTGPTNTNVNDLMLLFVW